MCEKNYNHIYYRSCPHFTVGRVDQWGEQGYLFFEGMIYQYYEDRKEQYREVQNPRSIKDFLIYAEKNSIPIPLSFLENLKNT